MTAVVIVAERSDDVSTFEAEDLRLLETLANHATIAFVNDQLIDRLRQEAAKKEHQALHDSLTGLPNRRLFNRSVEEALRGPFPDNVAVALMDLDQFKDVNDTLGHEVGDALLCEVGSRLRQHIGDRGIAARLGGDEFGIVFTRTSATH